MDLAGRKPLETMRHTLNLIKTFKSYLNKDNCGGHHWFSLKIIAYVTMFFFSRKYTFYHFSISNQGAKFGINVFPDPKMLV